MKWFKNPRFLKTAGDDKEVENKADEDAEPIGGLPDYLVPPGGFPKKNERFRPKKSIIKGDPDLPREFSTHKKFPMCIPEVMDQQICGSCWAFASSGMLSDRFCTHSEGQIKVSLSVQDMINCDLENFGCEGGYFVPAIDFLSTDGTVSN